MFMCFSVQAPNLSSKYTFLQYFFLHFPKSTYKLSVLKIIYTKNLLTKKFSTLSTIFYNVFFEKLSEKVLVHNFQYLHENIFIS